MAMSLTKSDYEAILFMAPRAINQLKSHIRGYENCPRTSSEKKIKGIEKSEKLMASICKLEAMALIELEKINDNQ